MGAGVKLSNLRNDGTEVYLRIGSSELQVVCGLAVQGCQLGCNAVTNPGTVLGVDSIVWPNAPSLATTNHQHTGD